MNERHYKLDISAYQAINPEKVFPEELRLISMFFPEILKEMIQCIEEEE